jgi:hypothetical protein
MDDDLNLNCVSSDLDSVYGAPESLTESWIHMSIQVPGMLFPILHMLKPISSMLCHGQNLASDDLT